MQIAHSDGGAVILSTSPYFADGTPNDAGRPLQPDRADGGGEYPYVSIDDLFTGARPGRAVRRRSSTASWPAPATGCIITEAAVDNLIEPALNQIIANVAGPVYAGNASRATAARCVQGRA